MFKKIPEFGTALAEGLAFRLQRLTDRIEIPGAVQPQPPSAEVLNMLPMELIQRHRILPLRVDGNVLTLGLVDPPTTQVITAVQGLLPSLEVRPLRIETEFFNDVLSRHGGVKGWEESKKKAVAQAVAAPAAPGPAAEAAGARGRGGRVRPPPVRRAQAPLARRRRHEGDGRHAGAGRRGGARAAAAGDGGAAPQAVHGGERLRLRLRAAGLGALPREHLPRPPRRLRGHAPDPLEDPELRAARAARRSSRASATSPRGWSWSPAPPAAASPPRWRR